MYRPELFIFDMDGLMFDTERISVPLWLEVARQYHIEIPNSFFDRIFGRNNASIKEEFLKTYGADFPYDEFYARKEEMKLHIYETSGAPMEPGLVECLEYARKAGIRCAVASSSAEDVVRMLLDQHQLTDYFSLIQSGDGLAHSKPAPDIFLMVCKKLAVLPERALVFEDSGNGLLAARAAGIPSVWVPDLVHVAPEVASSAWQVCKTLADVVPLVQALAVRK